MTVAAAKKIVNRTNNLTLQEKRSWRAIIDALYTDLADTNTFVAGDYYHNAYDSSTALQMDTTVGYEAGLWKPLGSSGDVSNGWTDTAGIVSRATILAATADGGASTEFTTGSPHGIVVGDIVVLAEYGGDEAYNGVFYVTDTSTTSKFTVVTPFTSNLAGFVVKPGTITCATTGTYLVHFSGIIESANVAASGFFKWFKNDSLLGSSTQGKHTFDSAGANIETPFSYDFAIALVAGDELGITASGFSWGDFKPEKLTVSVTQLA